MLDRYAEQDRRKARERQEAENFPWEKGEKENTILIELIIGFILFWYK